MFAHRVVDLDSAHLLYLFVFIRVKSEIVINLSFRFGSLLETLVATVRPLTTLFNFLHGLLCDEFLAILGHLRMFVYKPAV